MEFRAYISVKGKKQGQFKDETRQACRPEKWMTVLSASMDLQRPIDGATGRAGGKRRWSAIKIVKEWGPASPQGLSACSTNEDLAEVRLEFVKPSAEETEDVYQAITLTDALLSEVRRFVTDAAPTPLEEWSFTFRTIEVVDFDGRTSFDDQWF